MGHKWGVFSKSVNVLPSGKSVSRKDLAHFVLDTIENDLYMNKIVALADAPTV